MMESDSSFAGTIRGMLEDGQNSAFQVVQAQSLRAAGPLLAAEKFDALLLDAQALGSGGISSAVKTYPQIRSLPIVALMRSAGSRRRLE